MTLSLPLVQRQKSLHEQIYQALRSGILAGEFAPGERLVETQLAEQLKVSRTPIREALRQLQRENLVTADTSGGLKVTTISVEDAAQLYDCRIALEQLSIQGACQQATSAHLEALNALVTQAEQMSHQPAIATESLMLDLDYQFHRLMAESSGNRWLVTLLDQVFDKMALLRSQTTYHNPSVLEIRNEHRQIYEAIAQRQVEAATGAIVHHLTASKQRVIEEVQQLQQKDEA